MRFQQWVIANATDTIPTVAVVAITTRAFVSEDNALPAVLQ